jgi:DHA2 family methylenomycin A resistance protein-like MFS transporter
MTRRRLLILCAFLAIATALVAEATSEYMLVPIQADLSLSTDETNRLALLPDLAGLIAVFLAGALAVRYGRRMLVTAGSICFGTGAVVVALAPNVLVLMSGRVLCGLGSVTLSVLGLSLINVSFAEPAHRARAFGALGALTPAVFIITPTISAALSDSVGWRFVPLIWIAIAAAVLALAQVSIPRESAPPTRQEFVTPLLAGLALTAFCLAAATVQEGGFIPAVAMALALTASVALVALLRQMRSPALDVRALRAPGAILAAGAVFMAFTVNISFYFGLYTQYRYDMPLAMTSLLLALPELAGIGGSILFGALAARIGPSRSATLALASSAVLAILILAITPTSPVWLVIAIAVIVNVPVTGAVGPLTENFLNFAPSDGSDAASSIQDAVTNIGYVIGGLAVGLIVFSGFERSLTSHLVDRGIPTAQAAAISASMRSGVVSEEIVALAPDRKETLREVLLAEGQSLNKAQNEQIRAGAFLLMGADGIAAALVMLSARRRTLATSAQP